ncbi:MAG TPA: hypothetical protein VJ914_01825 [Pseudonocardiaceae bacterium]|nr:hypothetical protein [Pseudonocardiaceae bacterium]
MTLVIDLRPPDAAGPLRIGSDRTEFIAALREFGVPRLVTRAPGRRPSWAVDRASGLAVRCHVDRAGHLDAVEFGRPTTNSDAVRYHDLDVFGTPAEEFVAALRRRTQVVEEEHGYACVAPDLLLSCWRATTPKDADDTDGRYFDSVLVARPGYYNHHP